MKSSPRCPKGANIEENRRVAMLKANRHKGDVVGFGTKITIIRIPECTRHLLGFLPKWKETNVSGGRRVLRHFHDFLAVYFTFGVSFIEAEGGVRRLPPAAIVIVRSGAVHGWSTLRSVANAVIGHFHPGHPAHELAPSD